jgi:hypothetical protein
LIILGIKYLKKYQEKPQYIELLESKKYTTLLCKKEIEFIRRLQNNEDIRRFYKPPEIRQIKYRLLYKRRILTDDLLLLNKMLDELELL